MWKPIAASHVKSDFFSLRIEAVDTTGNHCADYSEFFAFCKLQVDSLLGRCKKGGELADLLER